MSGKYFEDVPKDELHRISDSVIDWPVLDVLDSPSDSGKHSLPGERAEMSMSMGSRVTRMDFQRAQVFVHPN